MDNFEVLTFPSDHALARAAAVAWLTEVETANSRGQGHALALSGGRITLKFFDAVVEAVGAGMASLANVDFFWADERSVPPTDPESSFAAAHLRLFEPLGILAHKVHRIRGEIPPDQAAHEASAGLREVCAKHSGVLPVLDLVFLGMGEDGHVASLFPSELKEPLTDRSVYRAIYDSPKPPPQRVTLSYAAIAAALQVWVLASGAGKESALRESLRPQGQTPLARVLDSRRWTKVFTDIRRS